MAETSQDIYYYKPLHLWANCIGILPHFNLDRLHEVRKPYWNGFVMAFIFGCIACYSYYGKVVHLIEFLPPSVFVTDIGGDTVLFVTTMTGIIRLSLVKHITICRLLESFKRIDQDFRTLNPNIAYPQRKFIIEFVMANILFLFYVFYDTSVWVRAVEWETYRWFFLRDVQLGHVVILSLVMRNYCFAIRNRMHILNDLLLQMRETEDPTMLFSLDRTASATNAKKDKVLNELWHVNKMRRIFARICRTIEIYNDIFGWVYLTMYVTIVVYLLTAANIALIYGIGGEPMKHPEYIVQLIILCVVWSLIPLGIGYFIFSAAERCVWEFKRTPTICYSVIDELTTLDQNSVLIPELEKFAQQVSNSHPEITAAGFFIVDYEIFFSLIGSLSSYFIVLIQFM